MVDKVCIKCGGTEDLRTVYYRGPKADGQKFLKLGNLCIECIKATEAEM